MTCKICGGNCTTVCTGFDAKPSRKNTPEASGTARKAPGDRLLGRSSSQGQKASAARSGGHEGRAGLSPRLTPSKPGPAETAQTRLPELAALKNTVQVYVDAIDANDTILRVTALAALRLLVGRPEPDPGEPWKAVGLSKRTYYRRKAEGKL